MKGPIKVARRYGTFTAARRAALRKAQLASAAKRRGRGKIRVSNRTKRVAKAAGVAGLMAAGSYGAHKAAGNRLIVSKRTPTVYHHISGRAIGSRGLQTRKNLYTYTSRNKFGDKHYVYAFGVSQGVFGGKISGHPRKVTQYKPPRARIRPITFHENNRPHSFEAFNEARRKYKSRGVSYPSTVSEAEALRRTGAYVAARETSGKKVSAAERSKALRKYRGQSHRGSRSSLPLRTRGRQWYA